VNAPVPIDLEKDGKDNTAALPSTQNQSQNWNSWQNMWQNQQMQAMGTNLGPTTPGMSQLQMNMGMFNPLMSQMNIGGIMLPHQMYNPMLHAGIGIPMGFNLPPVPSMSNMMMGMDPSMMVMDPPMVGMDPSMMAAHQQAMAIAKQAYQMAIAQQAIAAAGDEWERSNNMGYNSVPRVPTMHGTPPGNAYGGGSLLGVEGQAGGTILGGSAYGGAFGPAQYQHDQRQMAAMGGHYGSSLEVEGANSRVQGGKPTVASTSSASPPAHLRGDGAPPMPPPSS
jgi:serine/arginine repetitive matrix protein 2